MEHPIEAANPPTWKAYVTLVLSCLLWVFGGVTIGALLSQWDSASQGATPDFAGSRMTMNLVFGGVVGLFYSLMRLAKGN